MDKGSPPLKYSPSVLVSTLPESWLIPGHQLVTPIWSHVPLDWDLNPKPTGWLTGSMEIGDGALRPVQVVRDCGDAPRYCVTGMEKSK